MSRAKKGLLYFLLILGAVVGLTIVFVFTQSERIAFKIGQYATARVGADRQIEIAIGDIGGNFVRDLYLNDLCITYTGSPAPHVLVSVPEIHIRFDLASILRRRIVIDSLHIKGLKVSIPVDQDGSRIYPLGRSIKTTSPLQPSKSIDVEIRDLAVDGGTILIEGKRPILLKDIMYEGRISSSGGQTKIDIDSLSMVEEGGLRLRYARGKVQISPKGTELSELRIATEKTFLGVSGRIGNQKDKKIDLDVVVDPLDLGEVGLMLGKADLSGSIKGEFEAKGKMDHLEIKVAASGNYKNFDFKDVLGTVLVGKKQVELSDLGLVLNGAPMVLSATYRLGKVPTYSGVVSFENLDISGFVNGDPRYSSDLGGYVRFNGRGISQTDFELIIEPHLKKGNYADWRFDEVRGEVVFDATSVVLKKVTAKIGGAIAVASGVIEYKGQTAIDFNFDAPDLKDLEKDYGIKGLEGELHAEGRIEYSDQTTKITTEANGEAISYKGVLMESLNVGLWLENKARWSGSIKAFGESLSAPGLRAKDFIADVTIDQPWININQILITRQDSSRIGLVGRCEFGGGRFNLTIERIFADDKKYIWQNALPAVICIEKDRISLEKLTMQSEIGEISIEDLIYAKGHFSLKAKAWDFNLTMLGEMSGKHIIDGKLGMDLSISGSQDKLDFDAQLKIENPVIQSIPFDLLTARFDYHNGIMSLRSLSLVGERARAEVAGWMPVDLSPSNISRHAKEKRLSKVFSEIGRFELNAQEIDASMLGLVIPNLKQLKGLAAINAVVSGNSKSPRIVSEGRMTQARYGNTPLGEISWSLIYEDSLLQIVEATLKDDEPTLRVVGVLPVVVCFDPMKASILDQNMNISVQADKGDIGLLCEIIPKLKVCSGHYWADLRIAGTPKDILFYGPIRVESGQFRVEGVPQTVKSVMASARAEGKVFHIDEFVADGGAIRGSGYIAINGSRTSEWNIGVELNDYYVGEYEDFVATVAGRIAITGEVLENGKAIPRIEGNLTVKRGEYYYSAQSAGGGGEFLAPTASPSWLMNIQVDIPKDFWVRGGDIEAELQGDLTVKRTHEGLVLLGSMKTLRGRFFVYHNVFRISKGEFRFSDVKSLAKAYIDLEAESRVLDEMIKIRANGSLDNLSISATSESGWSETQIFEALTLRRGVSPDQPTKSGIFSDALLRSWALVLANQVSEEVARELRLDRFGIEFGDVGEGDAFSSARLTLGKYLMSNIYLEYTQALGSLYGAERKVTQRQLSYPERRLSVEYRLSTRLSVEGETGTIGGLSYFEVDLKLRLEY